ncbi:alpha-L-fucosidase [Chitinophagaceae bacterium 26-R-25]|nr:alpha-L-fucosidase [Chitinophagaceae bacterium 26-R-25]
MINKLSFTIAVVLAATAAVAQTQNIPLANTILVDGNDSKEVIIEKATHVVPTNNQLSALKNEFIAFIHFGPNSFTRREWGTGQEDPKVFDLKELHTDQWCEAMKAAGMKMVIFTAKHHDGFVLWQSRYTTHGIMSTNFENGKGDVLKALAASCKKYGLKLGIYLSPADLFQIESPDGLYGNLSKYTTRTIPKEVPGRPFQNKTKFQFAVDDYNEYFLNQLFELLTEYGPISEVWFDGATPKTKGGQQYNYIAWKKLIHTLAPQAVIFGKEDIRWCGNEAGGTRDTEWNVVAYSHNPDTANYFHDMTAADLGSREKLYDAKYLHYEQAETNTSIREGWFYRDDTSQKVRSADDVFDMYERSVGGNSTFLLNIPPNRDGKFSAEDVGVLKETGKRISETYGHNLLAGASGPRAVLDKDLSTYMILDHPAKELVITTASPITINRFMIQEAIDTHSERVEKHAVDAWINGQWQEIVSATNIGYKRILRFPEVTSSKFRLRILESRFDPAIATVAAYKYKTRPPQLQISRDAKGMVTIAPAKDNFGWKPHRENAMKNLNGDIKIYYTLDGSEPSTSSNLYTQPFKVERGEVKAVVIEAQDRGSLASQKFGISKERWILLNASSEDKQHPAINAFDADDNTWWQSNENGLPQLIAIDLGKNYTLKTFAYTPQNKIRGGMMAKGIIKVSDDGKSWREAGSFAFGNLVNDPSTRTFNLPKAVTARYVQVQATALEGEGKFLTIAELDFL